MKRQGSAQWLGGLSDGKGTVSTESGVLTALPYSFKTRFEEEKGTNPEELLAAAYAGCFSMAFAAQLGKVGLIPQRIDTTATVSLEKVNDSFSIPSIHLKTHAHIPNADKTAFDEAVNHAKAHCPLSKLFNANITLDATLYDAD